MNFNFALILFWLAVVTGVIWLADLAYFAPRRRAAAKLALEQFDAQAKHRVTARADVLSDEREALRQRLIHQPGWIEFPAGFFPVIMAVFLLRSFLFEPFRIPSGSMIPTLLVGDLILVNKFSYGIRLPILNKKIVEIGNPQRGDVMVFRYPKDPTMDYIKRVIGVPGDKIVYQDKRLTVNGQLVGLTPTADYYDTDRALYSKQFVEHLPGPSSVVDHKILVEDSNSGVMTPQGYNFSENCSYSNGNTTISCVVPAGHYFMMGDNRDNSLDSRYWGFVPDQNIVGRAFFIWMNFGNINRIGTFH